MMFVKLAKNKSLLCGIGFLLAVVLIFLVSSSPAIVSTSLAAKKLPVYCVQRDDGYVSLTFDAAWGNEDTQLLIDILGEYGARATFFVVGDWVEKYPESVKALSDAGHEVMTHSDDHAHFSQLSAAQIRENIGKSCDKIEAVTGTRPTLFRCPYGEYDDHVIETLTELDMMTIQWDVDSLDWKDLSAPEICRRVTEKLGSGSIVLFHNAAKHTPEALPDILAYIQKNGYTAVPVSELLLTGDFEMDHTGRMCRPGTA